LDPVIAALIEAQALNRFGIDSHEQSSLHFLSTLDSEGSALLTGRPTYRMQNGLSSLTQTLAQRIAGVIPEHTLRTNRPLIEIEEDDGRFTLTFQGPRSKEVVFARNIICTLPFTRLRQVKGIQRLKIGELKKEAILNQGYATHSKGILVFESPFWLKNQGSIPAILGNFTGDFTSQKMWDSGRTQESKNGILAYQRAGDSGLKAGEMAPQEALKDLGLFYKEVPAIDRERQPLINWRSKIWNQGSMAYFKPGQYMRLKGVAGESEYNGRFQFAGEHTSLLFAGTLQGALESGVRAANAIKV
jgi:monoamine oxidase